MTSKLRAAYRAILSCIVIAWIPQSEAMAACPGAENLNLTVDFSYVCIPGKGGAACRDEGVQLRTAKEAISSLNQAFTRVCLRLGLVTTTESLFATIYTVDDRKGNVTASESFDIELRKKRPNKRWDRLYLIVPHKQVDSSGESTMPYQASLAEQGVTDPEQCALDRDGAVVARPNLTRWPLPHEVGHWLGLHHTHAEACAAGSKGDYVSDTAPLGAGTGLIFSLLPKCDQVSQAKLTTCNGQPIPAKDLANYMSYSPCPHTTFTLLQQDRTVLAMKWRVGRGTQALCKP